MIANGIRVWLYDHFNIWLMILLKAIHFYKDAHYISNFVRDVLDEFLGVFYAYDLAFVIDTHKQSPSMGISEAAYPFEILVTPRLLVFYVLILVYHDYSFSASNLIFTEFGTLLFL